MILKNRKIGIIQIYIIIMRVQDKWENYQNDSHDDHRRRRSIFNYVKEWIIYGQNTGKQMGTGSDRLLIR